MRNDSGISKNISGAFADIRLATEQALASEGFGILTTIDIGETLRKKLGVEMGRYLILGACHPASAYRAIQADKSIGLFLPCNVVMYEESGSTVVSCFDPTSVVKQSDPPELLAVAQEIRSKFIRVIDTI